MKETGGGTSVFSNDGAVGGAFTCKGLNILCDGSNC